MKGEADVLSVSNKYRIYCERRTCDGAEKTVLMVNGALATTNSCSQTIRNLKDHTNIVLFDLPFAGRSREHNPDRGVLTKDDEVDILLHLIARFEANYLLSASWGG